MKRLLLLSTVIILAAGCAKDDKEEFPDEYTNKDVQAINKILNGTFLGKAHHIGDIYKYEEAIFTPFNEPKKFYSPVEKEYFLMHGTATLDEWSGNRPSYSTGYRYLYSIRVGEAIKMVAHTSVRFYKYEIVWGDTIIIETGDRRNIDIISDDVFLMCPIVFGDTLRYERQ